MLADRLIHGFAGHADDPLLAGVFSRLSPAYLKQYVAQLARALPAAEFPSSWAVHDYGAVTRGYQGSSLAPLAAFDEDLGTDTGGRAKSLWITEAGMLLTSRSKRGDCPAAGADPAGTIGACINGNGPAQLADIISFFELPRAGTSVPITHLFWYEWQGEPAWDSGITDAAGSAAPRVVRVLRLGQLHRQPRRVLSSEGDLKSPPPGHDSGRPISISHTPVGDPDHLSSPAASR